VTTKIFQQRKFPYLRYKSCFTKLPEIHQFSIIQFVIILIPCILVLFLLMNMSARNEIGTHRDARSAWTQHGW